MMPIPSWVTATKPPALSTRKRSPGGEPERSWRRMSDWADAGAVPAARASVARAAAASVRRWFGMVETRVEVVRPRAAGDQVRSLAQHAQPERGAPDASA